MTRQELKSIMRGKARLARGLVNLLDYDAERMYEDIDTLSVERLEESIHETKRTVKAKQRPIVIITSNAEKELPDAFLRRCIFHYIDFPDKTLMEEIVRVHFPNVDDELLKNAMDVFYEIRSFRDIRKKPSTSELIDWINALQIGGIPVEKIKKELPFIGVVVKKDEDMETAKRGNY